MSNVCVRCQAELPPKNATKSFVVTNSICPDCRKQLLQTPRPLSLTEFLNRFAAPVLVVDSNVRVQGCNEQAQALLGKTPPDMLHHLSGDVIECAYARLPGGCGNTEHCKACTIRRTVSTTHATGVSQEQVPAYADIMTPGGVREKRFLISTEKVGQFVLLRIDVALTA
jgi:hypothetical protein